MQTVEDVVFFKVIVDRRGMVVVVRSCSGGRRGSRWVGYGGRMRIDRR